VRTIGHEELNLKFARAGLFWLLATLLALLSAASSAPSPIYAVYAARWHFSPITLTAIFGVYALALLAALLTTGRLSDHLGRRPVVLLAGVLAFIAASGAGWLFTARILQGLGTGMAAGAISAWLVDLQPPDRPGLGSVVGSVTPISGLAAGTLGAGLLVQYGPDPLHTRELNGLESIQATSCRMMGFPRGGAASQRRTAVS